MTTTVHTTTMTTGISRTKKLEEKLLAELAVSTVSTTFLETLPNGAARRLINASDLHPEYRSLVARAA